MLTLANKNSIEVTNAEEHYLDKQEGKIGAHPNPPNETRWPAAASFFWRPVAGEGEERGWGHRETARHGTITSATRTGVAPVGRERGARCSGKRGRGGAAVGSEGGRRLAVAARGSSLFYPFEMGRVRERERKASEARP
jgi:hypothetical protein